MKGLSGKEIKIVSYLELEGKRFFTRNEIKRFFKNDNEMNAYIHRLKKKGRIAKINKSKYYLFPIEAYEGNWSEHPFIVVDEVFNSSNYCIGGKASAYYWGLIQQIPVKTEVFSTTRQGEKEVLGLKIEVRRVRKLPNHTIEKINNHPFIIATKEESKKWI